MPVDRFRRWLEDADSDEPIEHWNTYRFYFRALEQGVTDRRAIANAIALVDAANRFSKDMPNVPYDDIVDALLAGLEPRYYLRWGIQRWWIICRLVWTQSRFYRWWQLHRPLKGWD